MKFFEKISVVKEAVVAFKTGGVSAMHVLTEGGVAGELNELADAANARPHLQALLELKFATSVHTFKVE